jgi:hypothetical protein
MTRTPIDRRLAGSVLAALALGLTTATAGAASFEPNQPAGTTAATVQQVAAPPALPAARPPDQATLRRAENRQAAAGSYTAPAHGRYSTATTNGYLSATGAVTATAPTATPHDSFSYRDAAIGAGVAVAIGSLIAAGSLAVRRRGRLQHS